MGSGKTLTDSLHTLMFSEHSAMTDEERREVAALVVETESTYAGLRSIPKRNAGLVMLDEIQHAVDTRRATPGYGGNAITCHKGCGYCCHQAVTATVPEAVVAWEYVVANNVSVDLAKLERQAKIDNDNWHTQPRADWTCTFLQADNTCGIYPARPANCRKHFSQGDPERCNLDHFKPGDLMKRWIAPEAEIYYSGFMNIFRIGPFARVLLIAKELSGGIGGTAR